MITNKPTKTSIIPSIKLEGSNGLLSTINPITDEIINPKIKNELSSIRNVQIPPIPSSIPPIPLFNTEPMVSIRLSVLNDLIQKIRIYEFMFQQLSIQSPYNINNTNYTPKLDINKQRLKPDVTLLSEPVSDQNTSITHIRKQNIKKEKERKPLTTRSYNKKIGHKYSLKKKDNNDNKLEKIGSYYVCKECGKRYQYRCNLRSHSKVHTSDAYICEFCNKKFGRKANYEEHRRVHTGELPFKCSVCKKKFRQKHALNDHKKLHQKKL